MATADEILATMAEEAAATDQMAEVCTIDRCTRAVTIPEALRIVGVETDKDVTRRVFRVLCSYRGTNLSTFRIRIHFMNANKERDIYYVTDAAQDGEYLTFSWVISRNATKYKGKLKFIACMVCDGGTDEEREWNSTLGEFTVLEGLEVELTDGEEEQARDAITQLLAVIDARESEAVEAVSAQGATQVAAVRAAGAQQEASIAAKGAATLETIPDDYATLRNNVAALSEEMDHVAAGETNMLLSLPGQFEAGSINGNGNNYEGYPHRVRSVGMIYFGDNTTLLIDNLYRIYVMYYDTEGNFVSGSGWVTSMYVIPADSRVRMVIALIDETGVTEADVEAMVAAVKIHRFIAISADVQNLKFAVNNGYNSIINNYALWEQGSYTSTDGLTERKDRIRLKWPVQMLNGVKILIHPNGQNVAANILRRIAETGDFETDFEYVQLAFGYQAEDYTFVSKSDAWLHFVVAKENLSSQISPSELDVKFELYDTYASREIEKAELERLSYGENQVRTIAHRGDVTTAPENTIAAYRRAVLGGYKYMETDVHFTADGVPVMLHDDTIDRTSNGSGNVADFTLAELKELDFGSWKSEEYAGEKIPTFEEMLSFCRATGIIPFIELKGQTQEQVELLVELVDKYGLLHDVHWISFNNLCLEYVRAVHADANLCYIHSALTAEIAATVATWKTGKNEVGILCYKNATEEAAEMCRVAGVYMMAGTITSAAQVTAAPAYTSWYISDGVNATKVLYDSAMGN